MITIAPRYLADFASLAIDLRHNYLPGFRAGAWDALSAAGLVCVDSDGGPAITAAGRKALAIHRTRKAIRQS